MSSRSRLILFAGMLLFLIGIFSGATAQLFHNPRLAVSGHLIAILNGMFLLIVGVLWPRLSLTAGQRRAAMGLTIFGCYANWVLTMLGAAWGTKQLTPIAGAGYGAEPWQEMIISVSLIIMILTMLGGVGLLLFGLRGQEEPNNQA